MDEGARNEEGGILFEEVCIVEEGVLGDPAGSKALGAGAKDLAVGGDKERTGVLESGDV